MFLQYSAVLSQASRSSNLKVVVVLVFTAGYRGLLSLKIVVVTVLLLWMFLLCRIRNKLLQMVPLVLNDSKSTDGTFSTKILNLDQKRTNYILAALKQSLSERFIMLSILLVLAL